MDQESSTEEASAEESELPSDKFENPHYWATWLDAARQHSKDYRRRCRRAWDEFQSQEGSKEHGGRLGDVYRVFPIFYSSIKTLQPAYFSKLPEIVGKRRFDVGDPIAATAARIVERMGEFSMDITPFFETISDAALDYILSDRATVRCVLDGVEKPVDIRKPLAMQQGEDGSQVFLEGEAPYEGEVLQDEETGEYFYNQTDFQPENNAAYLVSVPYDEVLHTTGAKSWDEVKTVAFRFAMPEEEAVERFEDLPSSVFKSIKRDAEEDDGDDDKDGQKAKEKYLHGWEIWHKPTNKVYWYSADHGSKLLDAKEDTWGLRGFFPCTPFIIGNKERKSLYGIPAYQYLEPICEQLHSLSRRLYKLIQHSRIRGLADASEPDLRLLVESADENEWIFVQNLASIVEKGGLNALIHHFPTGEISQAIVQMSQLVEKFKGDFYEIYGIPDVVRGVSDPLDGVGTQQIKSIHATNRFRYGMNQVAEMIRASLELVVDLMLAAFTDEQIAKIVGYEFMDVEDKQRFGQALALLRDDDTRMIRVDIETDSTSYLNEQIEWQNRSQVIQTVMQGLQQVGQLSQSMPAAVPVALKAIVYSLSGLKMGKDFDDEVMGAARQLMEAQNQPAEPPAPDYEQMKLQLEQQKLQLKNQELALKNQTEQFKLQMAQQAQQFQQWLDQSLLSIEQYKAQVQGAESMAEEQRLAHEVQLRGQKQNMDFQKSMKPESPAAVVVNNVPAPAPGPMYPPALPTGNWPPDHF